MNRGIRTYWFYLTLMMTITTREVSVTNLLLIDDDQELGRMLQEVLRKEGWELRICHNGKAGLHLAIGESWDLILLDIMLPDIDGLQILQQLRQSRLKTPIIMLTARGEQVDRVVGLDLGADDYLSKPFYPRELVARIRACLRRIDTSETPDVRRIRYAGVELDLTEQSVHCDQEHVVLTPTEFDVLQQLVTHHGQLVTKDSLSMHVMGRQLGPYDRSLDVHVSNIRKKLPQGAKRIETVRGRGYRMVEI